MDTLKTLKKARKLVSEGWCRGAFRTPRAGGGVSYCAVGALREVCGPRSDYGEMLNLLFESLTPAVKRYIENSDPTTRLTVFNDDLAHDKRDVLRVFDRAIKAERRKAQAQCR